MQQPLICAALALTLGIFVAAPVEGSTQSLVGPLTAHREGDEGMLVSGTIQKIPAGTKLEVMIIHQPGGQIKPVFVAGDDNVFVRPDGTFHANLATSDGSAFREGIYTIEIESRFTSAWQTHDVLEKAGITDFDSRGRTDIYTNPKAIPETSDFKPYDSEFPNEGRYLSVTRQVKLILSADVAAIDGVRSAVLTVQGRGRSSVPIAKSVEWFAHVGGFKPLGWSAELGTGGKWVVTLDCIDGEKQEKAQWSYDPKSRTVKYLNLLAKTVSYVPAE